MDMNTLLDEYFNTRLDIRNLIACQPKRASTKKEISDLEKQLDDIRFKLELPYKLLHLITDAQKELVEVYLQKISNLLWIKLVNSNDRYTYAESYLHSINKDNIYKLEEIVNEAKDKRLEEEVKQKLKETALSKLTKEEKEVLGLING